MASRYTDGHVVEDHVGDLLILIGYFRDEMCWGNSITVHSQIYSADVMLTMACCLGLYVIVSLMVHQGK